MKQSPHGLQYIQKNNILVYMYTGDILYKVHTLMQLKRNLV